MAQSTSNNTVNEVENVICPEESGEQMDRNSENSALRSIYNNVRRCDEAARIEYLVQSNLMKCNDAKYMANVEDSLLNLACSGSVDSLFFTFCFKFVDESGTEFYINRFIEFGSFDGFNAVLGVKLDEKFQSRFQE